MAPPSPTRFSLVSPPLLIPRLRREHPPNIDAYLKGIPGFVFWLVVQAIDSIPHYEVSLYGPWICYLHAIFLVRRYFVIKPQTFIRPVVDEEGSDEEFDFEDISFGSYGGTHQARGHGIERDKSQPDFTIVKRVVRATGEVIEVPIAVVEIKRDSDNALCIHGFLLMGKQAMLFVNARRTGDWRIKFSAPFSIRDKRHDTLTEAFCRVAIEAWNEPPM